MPFVPDFGDPRYLHEVGWFLSREKYGYNHDAPTYAGERLVWSQMLLDEVLGYCGHDLTWLEDKTVVSVGCGCTGDLAVWPAALKVAVDPLVYVYQKLGMLLDDAPHTSRTTYLAVGAEQMPLLDHYADLVVCRNALDHMLDPERGLQEIWRVLKSDGRLFLSVDVGGEPTPDEPTVFSVESLRALLGSWFETVKLTRDHPPHAEGRDGSVNLVARRKPGAGVSLDKEALLHAYEASLGQHD